MGTARSILAGKAIRETLTTGPTVLVYDAISVMAEHGIGALVVLQDDKVVGIITERDYLRKVALKGKSSRDIDVESIMSSPVVHVTPTATVDHCMQLMTEHRCRHLPVIEAGRLTGLVSIGDCVKQMVREQKDEIRFLNEYIAGPAPA